MAARSALFADRGRWVRFALFVLAGMVIPLLSLRAVWTLGPDGLSYASSKLPEWDFANLWAGGVLGSQGQADIAFDPVTYRPWFLAHVGADGGDREWSYPPNILLLAAPLAALPLFPAYLVWSVGGLILLWLVLRWGKVPHPIALATVLGPGTLTNLFFAQTGALTAALFLGALLLAARRRAAAGIMAGLLTIKPHLAILLPVGLLAAGRWRTVIIAAVTALATALCASVFFGWTLYPLYFTKTAPVMRAIMEAPFPTSYQANSITVFLMARAAGAGIGAAYVTQAIAAIAAAVVTWRLWRAPSQDPLLLIAATGCLSLLATPYGYTYDMVVFTFACAVLFDRADWGLRPALIICWLWPSLSPFVTASVFPIGPVFVALAAALASVPSLRTRTTAVPRA
jgi:hypothetical protein